MHDRTIHGLVEPDDGDFRRVDDRGGCDAPEPAQAGDGDGGTDEFVARGFIVARRARTRGGSRRPDSHKATAWALRTTGTFSPSGVWVAMPTCTADGEPARRARRHTAHCTAETTSSTRTSAMMTRGKYVSPGSPSAAGH